MVPEEEIIETSMGLGSVSAYCFVYVRPEILEAGTADDIDIIPLSLKTEIHEDNRKIAEEIVESRANS